MSDDPGSRPAPKAKQHRRKRRATTALSDSQLHALRLFDRQTYRLGIYNDADPRSLRVLYARGLVTGLLSEGVRGYILGYELTDAGKFAAEGAWARWNAERPARLAAEKAYWDASARAERHEAGSADRDDGAGHEHDEPATRR